MEIHNSACARTHDRQQWWLFWARLPPSRTFQSLSLLRLMALWQVSLALAIICNRSFTLLPFSVETSAVKKCRVFPSVTFKPFARIPWFLNAVCQHGPSLRDGHFKVKSQNRLLPRNATRSLLGCEQETIRDWAKRPRQSTKRTGRRKGMLRKARGPPVTSYLCYPFVTFSLRHHFSLVWFRCPLSRLSLVNKLPFLSKVTEAVRPLLCRQLGWQGRTVYLCVSLWEGLL